LNSALSSTFREPSFQNYVLPGTSLKHPVSAFLSAFFFRVLHFPPRFKTSLLSSVLSLVCSPFPGTPPVPLPPPAPSYLVPFPARGCFASSAGSCFPALLGPRPVHHLPLTPPPSVETTGTQLLPPSQKASPPLRTTVAITSPHYSVFVRTCCSALLKSCLFFLVRLSFSWATSSSKKGDLLPSSLSSRFSVQGFPFDSFQPSASSDCLLSLANLFHGEISCLEVVFYRRRHLPSRPFNAFTQPITEGIPPFFWDGCLRVPPTAIPSI